MYQVNLIEIVFRKFSHGAFDAIGLESLVF